MKADNAVRQYQIERKATNEYPTLPNLIVDSSKLVRQYPQSDERMATTENTIFDGLRDLRLKRHSKEKPSSDESDDDYDLREYGREFVQLKCNCLRCLKMFSYHFFFPFSMPFIWWKEGASLTYATGMAPCCPPREEGRRCRMKPGYSCLPFMSQFIFHPMATLILLMLLTLMLVPDGVSELPCASIVKVNVLLAIGYHVVRDTFISVKYGLTADHEFQAVLSKPFHKVAQLWNRWHLNEFCFPKHHDNLREMLQLAILREGIDAPMEETKQFAKDAGFTFRFHLLLETFSIRANHIFKSHASRSKNWTKPVLYPLRDISLENTPHEVAKKLEDIYISMRKKEERVDLGDLLKFRTHFALVVLPQSVGTSEHVKCELCIEGREMVLQALAYDLRPLSMKLMILFPVMAAILQTLIPWVVVLAKSDWRGGFDAAVAKASLENAYAELSKNGGFANNTRALSHWNCEQYRDLPLHPNGTVLEQILWSSGSSALWQGATLGLTIMASLVICFYSWVMYFWLLLCVNEYARRASSLRCYDNLLKRRFHYATEHGNEGKGRQYSLRAHKRPPVLSLSSPVNVHAFISGRKLLKKIGLEYHYRAQLFTGLLGFIFLVVIGYFLYQIIKHGDGEVHNDALLASALVSFVCTSFGILEMMRQGYLANYQTSRAIQRLHEQRMDLANAVNRDEHTVDDAIATSALTSLEASANNLRVEWARQPIRFLYIPANLMLFRLYFTAVFTLFAFVAQRRFGLELFAA